MLAESNRDIDDEIRRLGRAERSLRAVSPDCRVETATQKTSADGGRRLISAIHLKGQMHSLISMAMSSRLMEGSFTLAVALATLAFGVVLRADLGRRGIKASQMMLSICTLPVVVGLEFAKSRSLAALVLAMSLCTVVISSLSARRIKIPQLTYMDLFAPAAIVATGISSGQRLIAGQTANSALLQLGACMGAGFYLWSESHRAHQWQRPTGLVFGEFLILSSVIAFFVDRSSRNSILHGSDLLLPLLLFAPGTMIVLGTLKNYRNSQEEHRILERIELIGDSIQPEYASPSPECPHPERWSMYDPMSAEVEILELLEALVSVVKPHLIVETGTFAGLSTLKMAAGLRKNGTGKIISLELDPQVFERAQDRIAKSGLSEWIELRNESSLKTKIDGEIDLLFSDSKSEIREEEVRRFLPQISPYGIVLMHDAASNLKIVRRAAQKLAAEGLISPLFVPTPRGLVIAQKRDRRMFVIEPLVTAATDK